MNRPSRFDTKKSPRLLSRVNSPKNLTQFGKPFRQINAQSGSSHFDPARTSRPSLLGRTTSDSVPPHVIRVRMEISSPTMAATDSTNQETIQQLPTFEKRPKRGSFFTGINSELSHGPVRGEILQNATATTFLSPSHTKLGFLSVRNQENLSQHIPRPTLYLNDNMSLTQTTGFAPQKIGANKDLISGGYNLLADPILTSRNVRNFTPN